MVETIDNFLHEAAPTAEQIPYANPYIAQPAAPEQVVVQQTYANGGYVDTPAEAPQAAPEVAPAQVSTPQPAIVKVDTPVEPWVVPAAAATPAPAEKKGRRTNEEIAAEYGVDLKDVGGTGKNGRITHDDIKAAGEAKATTAAAPAQQFTPPQEVQGGTPQEAAPQQAAPQQFQPTPEQFAAFQAQQQAQQPYAQQQAQQPYAQPQIQQPYAQAAPQFQQPTPQAPQNFTPPPALPEGFAPQAYQQAY